MAATGDLKEPAMRTEPRQPVLFEGLFDKTAVVEFTAPDQSSDGGALLLKAVDERLGLTRRIAEAIHDRRQTGKVIHGMLPMLRERIYGIACGYPNGNDAARLGADPIFQLICERREASLPSQPTLSRFENAVTRTDLLRVAYALTDSVIDQQRRGRKASKVKRIIIDLDPTDDPTHGAQQLTLFNGFYDTWCYLPMITTFQIDGEKAQYLVAPVLRPGNAPGSAGAIAILSRLVVRLRAAFPNAKIIVRADGAFAVPELLLWIEKQQMLYVINLPKNRLLEAYADIPMKLARKKAQRKGRTCRVWDHTFYQAKTWPAYRRLIIKAEVTVLEGREPRDNPRFLVTNLKGSPQEIYALYADRGDMENRIKELKDALRFDLTSCGSFLANQFRNLLTAAAFVLYQHLRDTACSTDCSDAQVGTLRERLIKVGVTIRESARRIFIEAPRAFMWYHDWRVLALRLGASP